MNREQFVAELAKLRPNSTFLNLHSYVNSSGEIANYNIIFHISYENALKRSIAILQNFVPKTIAQAEAKHSVMTSYISSLEKIATTPIDEIDDAYTRFFDGNGSYIKGIKLHTDSDTLHLYGMVHKKIILTPGIYKQVKSAQATIEKNKIRNLCPVNKFRQFIITPFQVEKISVQGLNLLPPS